MMGRIGVFVALAASAVLFTNCSEMEAKSRVRPRTFSSLMSQPLFQNLQSAQTSTSFPQQVTPSATPPPFKVAVSSFNSNDATSALGGNITSSAGLKAVFVNSMGTSSCEVTAPSIREDLVNQRALIIKTLQTDCPALMAGDYDLQLVATGTKNLLFGQTAREVYDNRQKIYSGQIVPFKVTVTKNATGQLTVANKVGLIPTVLMAKNTGGKGVECTMPAPTNNNNDGPVVGAGAPVGGEQCEVTASPLLAQISRPGRVPRPIELTAPLSGILFDILGANSFPVAHAAKRISWFTRESAIGNFYLVLPDGQGRVNGIDEMFGNNTRGPDGQFAANGYEALRKWDGRKDNGLYDAGLRDGNITRLDPVFSRLRLWEDLDADGIASLSELHSLDEFGVISVNLNYDASYREQDQYGNEINLKSFLFTSDGRSHVVYDIWFRIVPQ